MKPLSTSEVEDVGDSLETLYSNALSGNIGILSGNYARVFGSCLEHLALWFKCILISFGIRKKNQIVLHFSVTMPKRFVIM